MCTLPFCFGLSLPLFCFQHLRGVIWHGLDIRYAGLHIYGVHGFMIFLFIGGLEVFTAGTSLHSESFMKVQ